MDPLHVLQLIRPGYLLCVLVVLAASQILFAFWPYRRRRYLSVLLLTALGVLLGQIWAVLGLPALQLGDANLLPSLVFVVVLQPLADHLPRPRRRPR
ncbi:MAG: hypothetical protein WAM30_14400 [Candidatus Dormiibacterota bacterium]